MLQSQMWRALVVKKLKPQLDVPKQIGHPEKRDKREERKGRGMADSDVEEME